VIAMAGINKLFEAKDTGVKRRTRKRVKFNIARNWPHSILPNITDTPEPFYNKALTHSKFHCV
jgi:hypothetical protein